MWLWGTIMMLGFVGLIAFVIWAIARGIRDAGPATGPADSTRKGREILAERYARGEIAGEEYRTRLGDL